MKFSPPMFVLVSVVLATVVSCQTQQKADLLLIHGKIYTVDSAFTRAEALAVKDGKILAVGSDAEMQKNYTAAETVDLGGKAVYPGFIDAHGHFVGYGSSLFTAALYGSTSFEEVVQRV